MARHGPCFRLALRRSILTSALAATVIVGGRAAFGAPALDQANPKRLLGRVTDKKGHPIEGALVTAYACNRTGHGTAVEVRTKEDGRIDMLVPFPSVRYTVAIARGGYVSGCETVLSGTGEDPAFTLETLPRRTLTGTVGDSATGRPAGGARVVLIDEHGFRAESTTDKAGRSEMKEVPRNLRQGVIYAEAQGRASPMRLIRGTENRAVLNLVAAAQLAGIVTEQQSRNPVPNCTVTICPTFASGFRLQTTTSDKGRFAFERVPPGRYVVTTSSDTFSKVSATGRDVKPTEISLRLGHRAFLEIALTRMATVRGRVLCADGPPAPDVPVWMKKFRSDFGRGNWQVARTDEQGRFSLRTGRLSCTETIRAKRSGEP